MASPIADNIYYDASLRLGEAGGPATYIAHRDTPVINNPNDYYLRVATINMSSAGIPLFIMEPGTLSITINASQVFLTNFVLLASQPNHVYLYNQFLQGINAAFVAANTAAATGQPPPVMIYNIDFNKFQLIIPTAYTGIIYFNFALYGKFPGLEAIFTGLTLGRSFNILFYDNGVNRFPAGVSASIAYDVVVMTYESIGYNNIVDIRSIQVVSNLMPVNQEYTSDIFNTSTNNFLPIIAEFTLLTAVNPIENKIRYTDLGIQYYIDLNSDVPMRTVDFQIYYTTFDNTRYLVVLAPFDRVDVKFNFIKKSLVNFDKSKLLRDVVINTSEQ